MWWSTKKIRIEILIYCLYWQLFKWLAAILRAWKVSDWVGSYAFSGEKFEDFSRIFQDPTFIYMNLPSTKQIVCVESYVHRQKCQTRRAWKQVQTRYSLCISGSMDMHERNESATYVFTYFKTYKRWYFSILFNKKNQGHSRTKTDFTYFQCF